MQQPGDPPLFREPPSSRCGRRRGGAKRARAKKGMKTPAAESAAMGDYFVDVGLDLGEPTTEGPPLKKK